MKFNEITLEVLTPEELRKYEENKKPIYLEVDLAPQYKEDRSLITQLKEGDSLIVAWWEVDNNNDDDDDDDDFEFDTDSDFDDDEYEDRREWGVRFLTRYGNTLGDVPFDLKYEVANRIHFIQQVRIEIIDYRTPRVWVVVEFE